MSEAKKIAIWNGMTRTHGFMVDVFQDEEQGLFIAIVTASAPALAPALRLPGQKPSTMSFENTEKLQSDDLETLRALTQKLLSERYGKILQFRERQP